MADGNYGEKLPRASTPRPEWLLFVSLVVMLNLHAVFVPVTGIDQYSLFALDSVAHRPYPLLISLGTNTILAVLASIVHHFLWKQQYLGSRGLAEPFQRAALVIGTPVLLAFLPSSILTVNGGQGYPVTVAFLIFAGLTIATALKDPETVPLSPTDSLVWIGVAAAVILVFLTVSIGILVLLYAGEISPPTANLFGSLKIDWSNMGYDPSEYAQRYRSTLIPFTMATTTYMVIVVGGVVLGSIWKAGHRHEKEPDIPPCPPGTAPVQVEVGPNPLEPPSLGINAGEAKPDSVSEAASANVPTVEGLLSQIRSLLASGGKIPVPDGSYVIVINGVSNRVTKNHVDLLGNEEVINWFVDTFDIYVNLLHNEASVDHKKAGFLDNTYLFCTLAAYASQPPGHVWENSVLEDKMMEYFPSGVRPAAITAVIGSLIDIGDRTIIERVPPPGRSRVLPMMNVCLVSNCST